METEAETYIKQEVTEGIDAACQTEDWEEERMKKYRNMKRKLMELIVKKKDYQTTLDKLNRRIQILEKKTRSQSQKRNIKSDDDTIMDISKNDNDEVSVPMEEDELDESDIEYDIAPEPKRARLTKRRRVLIPRDENGNIVLPFKVASLNVISLGKVDYERPQFHNERYIFPIGYTVERLFMSMVDPENQTTYRCSVEDGGKDGPFFTISAADAPEIDLSAKTATGVWALVIKRANEVRQKETSNAISGPEYYGFAHPIVIEMMEELDNVDKCVRYKRKHKPVAAA